LHALATTGPWREALDLRYACNAPVPTTILGSEPALVMQCTRRVGGWPQIALAAAIGGKAYLADGILPTLPVMERAIGVQSGRVTANVASLQRSAVDALLARQLAAHAFSASDVGGYEKLMALGARNNLAENFAAAETAYRAALALQQKALGKANPDTVDAMMSLALQLSDQQRFAEADALFRQAEPLAAKSTDKAAPARLWHYEALNDLNQGRNAQALALLDRADVGYASLVPAGSLSGASSPAATDGTQTPAVAPVTDTQLMVDPTAQSSLMGLIEVRRYKAVVLRLLGRPAEGQAAIDSAETLARTNSLLVPLVAARLIRTAGNIDAASGETGATAALARSQQNFSDVLPQTRPVAETALLQAREYAAHGDTDRAIALCRGAATLLRELRSGTDSALLEPCLASYALAASKDPAARQSLLRDMFETAELAQGSITSREIGEAAARLAANARDPKVAAAIRRRQDAADKLTGLNRQRDDLAHRNSPDAAPPAANAIPPADLDKAIASAQADLADADAALQAAAPNYGQLVQEVVPATDVLKFLRPDEAFAAIVLTRDGGWTFLLRNGQITAAPIHADAAAITALVVRLRASIEETSAGVPVFDIATAQKIYDDTLRSVAPELAGTKSLVVAPSGALLSLPFGVLLTGPADPSNLAAAPWLIRQVAVAHVPSAANFVALRKAGVSHAPRAWFGFGNFHPVTMRQAEATFPAAACHDSAALFASLPPLPSAQRELDAARAIVGGNASDQLIGSAFTAAAVQRTDLKGYRILHFATHALLPAELRCQDEPAIVTSAPTGAVNATGALLTTSNIVSLNLDADLVILSACNSGGPGGSTAGESLSGLARAFFYAGARALLVTHWSVNDQAAAYLVVDTLHRLQTAPQAGLAVALQQSELSMLNAAGHGMPAAIAHPFFWAPFAVTGDAGARLRTVRQENPTTPFHG
jgi:CHAT domain-containing protein